MQGIFLIVLKHWYNVSMEIDMNENNWSNPCPKYDCRKDLCKCGLKYVNIPVGLESEFKPTKGAYCNAVVEYESTGDIYIYSKEGIPVLLNGAAYPYPEDSVVNLSVVVDESSWRGATGDYIVSTTSDEVFVGSSVLYPAQGNTGLFVNDDTGDFVTVEQAYKLLDSGKKVRFNSVPIGKDLLNPYTQNIEDRFDGVELPTKYSAEVNGVMTTYYSGSVFHPMNSNTPPLGVAIRKTVEDSQEEYAFIVQGKIND